MILTKYRQVTSKSLPGNFGRDVLIFWIPIHRSTNSNRRWYSSLRKMLTLTRRPKCLSQPISNTVHTGENCFYFFIKRGDRIYPVMPRRFLSVLFDTWGTNLKDYFPHYRKNSQTLRASDTNRIPPLRTRAIRQMFKTGIVYD